MALALAVGLSALTLGGAAFAVVGGSDDTSHTYVAAVFGDHELCTGSFVSPTVVVTAAHCVAAGAVRVTLGAVTHPGTVFTTTAPVYTGTAQFDHSWCFGCDPAVPDFDSHDFAVIVLASPVQLDHYASFPALGSDDSLPNNQALTVVGYGVSAIHAGAFSAFGTRQSASAKIVGVQAETLKLSGGPGACSGDSGGPDLLSGSDTMVGITAYSGANPNCNGVTYSQRLDTAAARGFFSLYVSFP